ncbi:MAG: phospholipase D-like domain-containing protein [Cyanobacteria bacterium J06635_13]
MSPSEIAQRDALTMLRKAGVEIIDDTADGSKGSGLMHHKFMVVDRQTVILGSANFTLRAFGRFRQSSIEREC